MKLIAIIPPGQTEITVNGLTQWDYGRKLEIHSDDLPAMVEVHFACAGMKDAVVRSCDAVAGVAEATIPDICLEQTSPITAWVYVIDDTEGSTVLTITLPITERARPQAGATVPEEFSDKYTEAVTAMNEAVQTLQNGDVKVAYAGNAANANRAAYAANAGTAETATSAGHATSSDYATQAEKANTIGKYLHYVHLIGTFNDKPSEITFQFVCDQAEAFTSVHGINNVLNSLGFTFDKIIPANGFSYLLREEDPTSDCVYCVLYGIAPGGGYIYLVGYDYTNHTKNYTGGASVSPYTVSSDVVTAL